MADIVLIVLVELIVGEPAERLPPEQYGLLY